MIMEQDAKVILESRLDKKNYQKLQKINNQKVMDFIAKYIEICNPSKIFVATDSEDDIKYIRESAVRDKGEAKLATEGHTVHFDGYKDQARDKGKTKFLLPKGVSLGSEINAMERDEGLSEIHEILKNIMDGHELFIKFFSLGPVGSQFTMPCLQLTDSAYVGHSEDLLYRQGYQAFLDMTQDSNFFKFVHSQGDLEYVGLGLGVSKNIDRRRVYIDLEDETIYSTNTQYGGNTIGLKKLAMRLGINKASKEGWLTEHMLIMGVHGPGGRLSYFTGAFPSMCGKTSTAMLEGESIVGDDIAYLRIIDGKVRGVNVEKGLFGIIEGINSTDDVLQWKALNTPGEIIVSNVLVTEDMNVYWNGKDGERPDKGINHSGEWFAGKKDKDGKEITPSHKNARFTIGLNTLDNLDPRLDDKNGVDISGFIYGGRDSDTSVPVTEAFDWAHGIVMMGAGLESETTAATLGQEGVRVFNPMSNLDFLSIPIGRYIQDNLNFGGKIGNPPRIFSVNYFLKDSAGNWLNHKNDKRIWLKWMDLRVNGEVDAIETPAGYIPRYDDLKNLFKGVFNKEYSKEDYDKQYTIRIKENLAKLDRLKKIYTERVTDTPDIVFEVFDQQRKRLEEAKSKYGDYILPEKFLE
jgi:phosphoenolpyruvate carboxykinase (GTP)